MAHTYSSLYYHVAFSTRGRKNLIPQEQLARLHAYMAGTARKLDAGFAEVGGTTDHTHMLLSLPTDVTVAHAVNGIKSNSSRWLHGRGEGMAGFAWQEGYGAFTVSRSNVDAVRRYVRRQPEHHRISGFEEEFRALLEKHGIAYDERHLWG